MKRIENKMMNAVNPSGQMRLAAFPDRKMKPGAKVQQQVALATVTRNTKRSQRSEKYIQRTCERCENQFTTGWRCQRFCRRRCQYMAYSRKLRRNTAEQRSCSNCAKSFTTFRKDRKFCSAACRKQNWEISRPS